MICWKVDKNSPLPIYKQLVNLVRDSVASGQLRKGEVLPSQRQLAKLLGLSRATIVKAMEEMTDAGLVDIKERNQAVVSDLSTKGVQWNVYFRRSGHRYCNIQKSSRIDGKEINLSRLRLSSEYSDCDTNLKSLRRIEQIIGTSSVLRRDDIQGNIRLMEQLGIHENAYTKRAEALAKSGKTVMYVAKDREVIGITAVFDHIKESSYHAIDELHRLGIKITMLTGDNRLSANALKDQLHLDEIIAEAMPEDKEKKIRELQAEHHFVAMVGDGINDAPALSSADVGIAIGAGSDIAIDSADVILMKSDLNDVVTTIALSNKVVRNIKQNLFWAFFYNCIGIPLAAGLLYPMFQLKLNPMFGALAMSLSSVCVVTNALRLRFFKTTTIENKERKEEIKMKKTVYIEGMMCAHCQSRVKEALNNIPGVKADVDLDNKLARIELSTDISDGKIKEAVEDAGYKVTGIE